MNKHTKYVKINGRRMTVTDFEAMPQEDVEIIDASGCTALTEIHAPNATRIYATNCTALTELHADKARYIDATGCTALTELHADNAEYIYATRCTTLTELHADKARYIHTTACTSLRNTIHGGEDSRGHYFFGFPQRGKYRIFAGCRNYTPEQALAHWGSGGPSDKPDCLALVQRIIAEIKKREMLS